MQSKPNKDNTIYSREKSSHWMNIIIGLIFIFVILFNYDSFIAGVSLKNLTSLFVFIFPIIGVALIYKGISARQQFLSIGPMPLKLSPHIGQIGGQIGGKIFYNHPWNKQQSLLTLICTETINEGHGDDVSSQTNTIWHQDCVPLVKPTEHGCTLEFCFDVDDNLSTNESIIDESNILWTLTLKSEHNDKEFTRRWTVPVEKGEERSSISIPEKHNSDSIQNPKSNADETLLRQINITENDNELYLTSSAGQIKILSIPIIIIGIIATATGIYLSTKILYGASVRSDMAPILTIAGLIIAGYGLFLNNRQLECKIIDQTVYVRRRIFGKIIYRHQGRLNSPKQLKLNKAWSSRLGNKKLNYMAVTAKVVCDDAKTRNLKLAENIEGRLVAEILLQKIVKFIS